MGTGWDAGCWDGGTWDTRDSDMVARDETQMASRRDMPDSHVTFSHAYPRGFHLAEDTTEERLRKFCIDAQQTCKIPLHF